MIGAKHATIWVNCSAAMASGVAAIDRSTLLEASAFFPMRASQRRLCAHPRAFADEGHRVGRECADRARSQSPYRTSASLTPADRDSIDGAVALIKQKQHLLALANLTGLRQRNPDNSAVRILRAYVLLELGNVSGALNDADAAEASGAQAAYKCWFLAQVARLAGNKPLCRREIKHIANDPTFGPRAEKLRRELDREPE